MDSEKKFACAQGQNHFGLMSCHDCSVRVNNLYSQKWILNLRIHSNFHNGNCFILLAGFTLLAEDYNKNQIKETTRYQHHPTTNFFGSKHCRMAQKFRCAKQFQYPNKKQFISTIYKTKVDFTLKTFKVILLSHIMVSWIAVYPHS